MPTRYLPLLVEKTQIAGIALACLMVSFLYAFVWQVHQTCWYSMEYEGHIFWACLTLADGRNIYDLSNLMLAPIIYNPLFILLGAGVVKLFGPALVPLRTISMLSTVASFLGLFCLFKRSQASGFQSVVGVLMFASYLPVLYWSPLARVDMLGLALAIWSLERFTRAWRNNNESPTATSLLPTLVLSLLSFFAKQQYLVIPLAIVSFCLFRHKNSLALKFLAVWMAAAAATMCGLEWYTGGYFSHLTFASALPWESRTLQWFLLPFLFDPKTMIAIGVIALGWTFGGRKSNFEALAVVLLGISLLAALYTMGLRAAYHNHLLCTEFALCWLTLLNLRKLAAIFSAPLIVSIIVSLFSLNGYLGELKDRILMQGDTHDALNLLRQAKVRGKTLLCEDPSLAISAGAQPACVDATTIMNVRNVRRLGFDYLVQKINRREYPAIVINSADLVRNRQRIWPETVISAIKSNYRAAGKSGGNGTPQTVFFPKRMTASK